ncbi:hypothetical protein [Enterococcus devriesei]|uniref:hypothetical protein n=1 Tax=Enterococcus devriesei TaxID=319970 RepID=UPI0036D346FE
MNYVDWLESLKAGDEVIIHRKFTGFFLKEVVRVNKNSIILSGNDYCCFTKRGRLIKEQDHVIVSARLLPAREELRRKATLLN